MSAREAALAPPRRAVAMPGASLAKPIVVYDGGCRMCRRTERLVRAFDWLRNLDTMPYEQAVAIFPEVERRELDEGIRVRFPDASVTLGIDAVRSIAIRTPVGFLPGCLLYVPPIKSLGALVYRSIAARRGRDDCRL